MIVAVLLVVLLSSIGDGSAFELGPPRQHLEAAMYAAGGGYYDSLLALLSEHTGSAELWHVVARNELRASCIDRAARAFQTARRLSSEGARAMGATGVRGVVVYLSSDRTEDVRSLMHSLHLLHLNLLSRFEYPVIVFHDGLSAEQRQAIRSASPARVSFEHIGLHELPSCLDASALQAAIDTAALHKASLSGRNTGDARNRSEIGCRFLTTIRFRRLFWPSNAHTPASTGTGS